MSVLTSVRRRRPASDKRDDAQVSAAPGQRRRSRWIINLVLALIGLWFLLPLVWLILAAFNPQAGPGLAAPRFSLLNFEGAFSIGAGR